MNRKDREEEKERLMKEVLGKKRAYERTSAEEAELSTGTSDNGSQKKDTYADTMRSADETLNALRDVLTRQSRDLESLNAQRNATEDADRRLRETVNAGAAPVSTEEVDALQQEIEKDYGRTEEQPKAHAPADVNALFEKIRQKLIDQLAGNDDAIGQLCNAFRRPSVVGREAGRAENVILVTGPKGSGKHTCITALARELKDSGYLSSDEVCTIDMSLYQSGSQEQIFLQDLYQALNGRAMVVCFENFESGFAPFLRMVDSLVCRGSVILSRRYVLNRGILVENQTGLVREAVDSMSAAGRYLVFVTSKGTSAVQDAFGADFLYHVLDTVSFQALSEDAVREIIEAKGYDLSVKANGNLKIEVKIEDALKDWVIAHYDKADGADAVAALFSDFYICLSQQALQQTLPAGTCAVLTAENDQVVGKLQGQSFSLTRSKTSSEEIASVNAELDQIVGLDQVKTYIHSLQDHIRMQELRRQQGMKASEISKHMIFTGNPGTGKTTIARLISRYMKAIGALSQGQLVEVTRGDLVAQYVGQTAPLTMNVIKSALGGVLFIDEAYSLYRGKDDSFGLECIDTIVKAMEDHRDDLIVILAGYRKEMSGFLEANSGLKSRFPNMIDFPDYTGTQLVQIADLLAKGKGYIIADDARQPLQAYFDKVQSINAAEAGNGRLARNVVEDAILRQSGRLVAHPGEKLEELRAEDFDFTVKVQPPKEESEF